MRMVNLKAAAYLLFFIAEVMIFPVGVWLYPYMVPPLEPWTTPVEVSMYAGLQAINTNEFLDVKLPSFNKLPIMKIPMYHAVVLQNDGFNRSVPRWDTNKSISKQCLSTNSEVQCMACALYFEARSETSEIQQIVGRVIINRVKSRDYPNTICGVVWQKKQFSWTHDGKKDIMWSKDARIKAVKVARQVLRNDDYGNLGRDFPRNACWYHDDSLHSTYWSKKMTLVKKFGPFYVYKGKACRKAKKKIYTNSIISYRRSGYILHAAVSPRL